MTTDEERREVARRLRDSAEERIAIKGTGNGNNWSWIYRSIFGHYMGTKKGAKEHYAEVANRLADLIEPSCDREALLALADEMEFDGAGALDDGDWCKPPLVEYARRIREALGVER